MAHRNSLKNEHFFSTDEKGAVRAGATHTRPPSLTEESTRAKSRGATFTRPHVRDDSLAGDAGAGTTSQGHGRDPARESSNGSH